MQPSSISSSAEQLSPPPLPQPPDAKYRVMAYYGASRYFNLPKGLTLYEPYVNDTIRAEGVPFSWWIKWDVLYYYDKNGVMCEIEGSEIEMSDDCKRPDQAEIEDNDDDDSDDDDANNAQG